MKEYHLGRAPLSPREVTREECNARLDALLAASRKREERAPATSADTQRAKLAALRASMASDLASARQVRAMPLRGGR